MSPPIVDPADTPTINAAVGTNDPLPQIDITAAKWNGDYKVTGYLVPGTDETFAVHASLSHKGRWTVTHVPSKRALRANLASREEAEDLACWVWCNCVDPQRFKSADIAVAVTAAGARARSRFSVDGIFAGRRQKARAIGTTATHIIPAEKFLTRRIREMARLRWTWHTRMEARARDMEQERIALDAARTELETAKERHVMESAARTDELNTRNAELSDMHERVLQRERDCVTAESAVATIRNQLATAIRSVQDYGSYNRELEDTGAMRALRGIRVREQRDLA